MYKRNRPCNNHKARWIAPGGQEDFVRLVDPNYSYMQYEAELRNKAVPSINPEDILFNKPGDVDTYSNLKYNAETPD